MVLQLQQLKQIIAFFEGKLQVKLLGIFTFEVLFINYYCKL